MKKTILALSLIFLGNLVQANTIECSGATMLDGQLIKPLLHILIEPTTNYNLQSVKLYKTNEDDQQRELLATGTLRGRLDTVEKNPIVLEFLNHSHFEGTMIRGTGAWKGALVMTGKRGDENGYGGFFRGCGSL